MDSTVVINVLVELAGLEGELQASREVQARNQTREGNLGELQKEYRRDADLAERTGQDTEIRYRRREGEIQHLETKLADRRSRVLSTADPRQTEALQTEIRLLEGKLDKLETRALELLDEAGKNNEEAKIVRRECAEQEDRRRSEHDTMEAGSARAAAAEEELVDEIERLIGMLTDSVSRHVRRLRSGLECSVVFLEGAACGGCFGQLPAQQRIAVEKGTALVKCSSCSRYVVHRPWR